MSRYDYGRSSRSSHRYDRYSMYPQSKSKGERAQDAAKKAAALAKKGVALSPVVLEGFAIATTFWGKAWCKNIESYHDYANRLPRGRSYVRSNSVIDLGIESELISAQVMGSSLYRVKIGVKPVAKSRWQKIQTACAGKIGSLVELLRGKISGEVMEIMTRHDEGLFPAPSEITLSCSCPDGARMCKHVAAAMYGIGSRLDTQPELLFLLRGVDSADLISAAADAPVTDAAVDAGEMLADDELADVFGVELQAAAKPVSAATSRKRDATIDRKMSIAPETPVSTPRGRPRKIAPPEPAAPVKAALRGRPRKSVPAAQEKAPEPTASYPRKSPGRPRKTPQAGEVAPAGNRPRGRPRKSMAVVEAPPAVKKPRGRPRKASSS
jgi:uncharacterized Zn finger protein